MKMKKSILIAVVLFSLNCYGQYSQYPIGDSIIFRRETIYKSDTAKVDSVFHFIYDEIHNRNFEYDPDTSSFQSSYSDNYSKPTLKVYDKTGNLIVESDSAGNIINHCITIQDLIDYQKQCYNDSFQIDINPSRWVTYGDGCMEMVQFKPVYKKEWRHKTPDFNEFIDLMTKKQN